MMNIQKNRIGKKNKNQDGTQITLEKELKSGISKDQKDGYPKGGRSIFKWTQYHRVNSICLLQCKYNLSQVTSKNQVHFSRTRLDTKRTLSRSTIQNT